MASYNGAKYIREQVASILPQLGSSDELIVSDDGSTDGTLDILQAFGDARIKILRHERKPGSHHFYPVTQNFENALRHAQGDFIFLADQDDVWLPHKVQTMLPYLQEDALVLSDAWVVDESLHQTGKLSHAMPYRKGYLRNLWRCTTQGCVCAFTRKVNQAILPFPDTIIVHDFWIRLIAELKFKVKFIPEQLMLYRRHEATVSKLSRSKNSLWQMLRYRLDLLRESWRRTHAA
jgi:glycosyltransferase involved in cell wall biosynthesis